MGENEHEKESFYATQYRHFRQCLRETRLIAVVWTLMLIYCTTVFSLTGYIPPEERPDVPSLILGIPSWVFWGLFFPWCLGVVFTIWFAQFYLKEDEPYAEFPEADMPGTDGGESE